MNDFIKVCDVEKYYGEGVFYEDAVNAVVPDAYDNALLESKSQIVESIKQVTDPEGQVVLEERYLCDTKWEDIASELGYTVRQIFRVHDAALKEIVVPESCQ